jgi:hypothetical protein
MNARIARFTRPRTSVLSFATNRSLVTRPAARFGVHSGTGCFLVRRDARQGRIGSPRRSGGSPRKVGADALVGFGLLQITRGVVADGRPQQRAQFAHLIAPIYIRPTWGSIRSDSDCAQLIAFSKRDLPVASSSVDRMAPIVCTRFAACTDTLASGLLCVVATFKSMIVNRAF